MGMWVNISASWVSQVARDFCFNGYILLLGFVLGNSWGGKATSRNLFKEPADFIDTFVIPSTQVEINTRYFEKKMEFAIASFLFLQSLAY